MYYTHGWAPGLDATVMGARIARESAEVTNLFSSRRESIDEGVLSQSVVMIHIGVRG